MITVAFFVFIIQPPHVEIASSFLRNDCFIILSF